MLEMKIKKKGYFSIENIDDPCVELVVVNSKEYCEEFKSQSVNKKHKGLKKGTSGMELQKG